MPHLEEQFPPVNPLLIQRPDALDPPDRQEEEDSSRTANRAADELPLPGSLADGIDRVTLSANARVIVPVPQAGETVPSPPNPEAQRQPVAGPGPEVDERVVSSGLDTRRILAETEETEALQPPAFPELEPDEPFVPNQEREVPEEAIPAAAQQPVAAPPPPAVEDEAPATPPPPGNVEALDENPQALRRDNLGTDPALRSNREIRNFLRQFDKRLEPPEAVTEPDGGPVNEVQNNAPPPPAVLENLEAIREDRLDGPREEEELEGVTRPEEEREAPPEPRTPESLLTGRGQNIDRFI